MNFKKLPLFIISLLFPMIPSFAMKMEKPIYEIIAEKRATQKLLDKTVINTSQKDLSAPLNDEYKKYEERLLNNENPTPSIDLPNGLDYTMSINNMTQITTTKFKQMEDSGLIIHESEFNKIKNQYDTTHPIDPSGIYGADYLEKHIKSSKSVTRFFNVLEYIIVIPDNCDTISITTSFRYPQMPYINNVQHLNEADIKIYFKNGGPTRLEQNNAFMEQLNRELEEKNTQKFIIFAYGTKNEHGLYYITDSSLWQYLENSFGRPDTPTPQNNFEEYVYHKFIHINPCAPENNPQYTFKYQLTAQSSGAKKSSPTISFAWILKNKLLLSCIITGAGIALYYAIAFVLNNKYIIVR